MSTVLSFDISGEDRNAAEERCEKLVWAKVNEIVAELKKKQAKFEDPDFGPTKNDELGRSIRTRFPGPPRASQYKRKMQGPMAGF